MLLKWMKLRRRAPRRAQPTPLWHGRFFPSLESLTDRITPSVTASFSAATGTLTIKGDGDDNAITVGRDAAGKIVVNNGAVTIKGGTATVANTNLIQVFGDRGNDTIALDEAVGPLPRANLFGGAGDDTLTGGAGADQLFGDNGNDNLSGKGGNDTLTGGVGNDTLTGGDADDKAFGQAGDDLMIWNPGDDTDLNEGGLGTDTVLVVGGGAGETFTATASGNRVRFDRVAPAPFSIDIGSSEKLVVNGNGGDDVIDASNLVAGLIQLTADGGAGNDTIRGSRGNDTLRGGADNDFIDGQQGNDTAFMGAGDDVFQWDPGDGSDVVEGEDGTDRMLFNGSGGDEIFAASAVGERARFTRNLGNIVMDLNDVEAIDLNALGGADSTTVNDLSGTDVTEININLALAGGAGDGAADSIIVFGTAGDDAITVDGTGGVVSVSGLQPQINISGAEAAGDRLTVNAGAGDDAVDATSLAADGIGLTVNGEAGNDDLLGGDGDDALNGGDDDDVLVGGPGEDALDGGAGENVIIQ